MNQPSYNKFIERVNSDGYLFYNSSIINVDDRADKIRNVVPIDANTIVNRISNNGPINIAFIAKFMKEFLPAKDLFTEALSEVISAKKANLLEINSKIFDATF